MFTNCHINFSGVLLIVSTKLPAVFSSWLKFVLFFPHQLEALLPPKPWLTQYSESEVEEVTMMDFDITCGSEDSGCLREAVVSW